MKKTIKRLCPAKVNLLLKVLGKRADGYHELLTVMHAISLADSIEVWEKKGAITLSCDHPEVPTDGKNLMIQAARLFLKKARMRVKVGLRLEKNIPVTAGLGGGSSDAAHTLLALNELFGFPLSPAKLWELASQLGSDAPFFLTGGTSICRGRGEEVEPIDLRQKFYFVLVNPGLPLSTKEVYEAFTLPRDFSLTSAQDSLKMLLASLASQNASSLIKAIENDLERAALQKMPSLTGLKDALVQAGLKKAWVSGSGPTVFGLAPGEPQAREIVKKARNLLNNSSFRWMVAQSF